METNKEMRAQVTTMAVIHTVMYRRILVTLGIALFLAFSVLGGIFGGHASRFVASAHAVTSAERVIDEVGVLSSEDKASLNAQIQTVTSKYGQDVVLLYADLNGKEPVERADDFYDQGGYGLGPNKSGILLLIAPNSRDWWISTAGDSIKVFSDRAISNIGRAVVEPLSESDWAGGGRVFIEETQRYFQAARDGAAVPGSTPGPFERFFQWAGALVAGIVGGGGVTAAVVDGGMKAKMRNLDRAPDVTSNFLSQSTQMAAVTSMVLSHNYMRVPYVDPSENDFSTTHTSGGGVTHGGGGGKF